MLSMLSERGRDALMGILENAEAALEFTDGVDAEAFAQNRMRFYAVTRCLEIVSEASRRVDEETRARHPGIPWRQIADAGNVYRHTYKNVTAEMVWRAARHRMSDLIAMCRVELDLSS
jgi:uncharacterized protein with HEPN domain